MIQLPPPCLNIEQVDRITMLGVVVNNRMTATDHVAELLRSCTKLLYALQVLRSHGLPQQSLKDVFRGSRHCRVQDTVCGTSVVRTLHSGIIIYTGCGKKSNPLSYFSNF